MVRGRDRWAWNHTSAIVATLFNCRPTFGKRLPPVKSESLHPYHKEREIKGTPPGSVVDLLELF